MATITVATGTDRLTPSEIEDLHIRLATANSLNDHNISVEGFISNILSGREAPVPVYVAETEDTEDLIRQQIAANDTKVWDSIFSAIENGQIDVLDHFVRLGLDVNQSHPVRKQHPIYHAVESSQTNMMRHLINLHAQVNSWSAQFTSTFRRSFGIADVERARTPLMCAAEQGNLNICKILCESAFADPMLIAPDGQTAQRLAARNGHREVVQYLPAHRGGSWLRLKYDYNHRWKYIRIASRGIYVFFKILLYEIPKFFLYELPWEMLKSMKQGLVELYRSIPPISEWPRIVSRAIIDFGREIKTFLIELAKVIKATPKALYHTGKYIVKKTWKGIKAIPRLVKRGCEKIWSALKVIGSWIKDLFLSILSFLHTLVSAILSFFRSITLADVIAGFKMVLRLIFVELPQMLWKGLQALGRGIHAALVGLFGCMYWVVYYIILALMYVALYVPKRIGKIVAYIAGGIAQAFRELWVWISPKSMM